MSARVTLDICIACAREIFLDRSHPNQARIDAAHTPIRSTRWETRFNHCAHRHTELEVNMDAEKIVKLTPGVIRELLGARQISAESKHPPGKRRHERWPFPGTVEVWLPDGCYGERHHLATLHNLSAIGLAMRTRRPIPTETRISLALHQPELSCYGHAIVRHCTRASVGYLIGVEFHYEQDGIPE
jgi:hypothetical protein